MVKAFINSIEDNQINISIPSLEIDNLSSLVLRYPGFSPNFNIGQIVCVDFINGDLSRPVILGTFQKDASHGRLLDASVSDVLVNKSVKISNKVNFGSINYDNIKNLANITTNIQSELENKLNYISDLLKELKDISNKLSENSENMSDLNDNLDILEDSIDKLYFKDRILVEAVSPTEYVPASSTLQMLGETKQKEYKNGTLYMHKFSGSFSDPFKMLDVEDNVDLNEIRKICK